VLFGGSPLVKRHSSLSSNRVRGEGVCAAAPMMLEVPEYVVNAGAMRHVASDTKTR
jgi:hypothetical protein